MKCKNCGAEIDENGAFCSNCGTNINNPVQQNFIKGKAESTSSFGKGIVLLGYLALIADLILCIGGFNSVRLINSDRLVLYPALGFMIVSYFALNIYKEEKDITHPAILMVMGLIFIIISTVMA